MAQLSKHTTPDGVETRHMARLSKHTTPDGVETRHMANISIKYIDPPGRGSFLPISFPSVQDSGGYSRDEVEWIIS